MSEMLKKYKAINLFELILILIRLSKYVRIFIFILFISIIIITSSRLLLWDEQMNVWPELQQSILGAPNVIQMFSFFYKKKKIYLNKALSKE